MTAPSRLGATIQGKYRLERLLGEGGMGVVYAARHLKLDRPVAIKMMHATFAANEASVRRFFDEARAAGSLRHPNVIDVLDVDADDTGAPFMVMELLEGEPLAALLARRGAIPAEEAVALLDPILDGLAAAHARGIVHRDLKPENIFLAREGATVVPKILDFGIAKLRDPQTPGTATGAIVGTPMYMAPEQAAGTKDIGPWVDVWAIGAVFFEAISGSSHLEIPAEGGVMAILSALATQTPRRLAAVAPTSSPTVAAAVDAALEPDPTQRIRSVATFRARLHGESIQATRAPVTSPQPIASEPVPSVPITQVRAAPAWGARLAVVAAIALVSLLALGAWATLGPASTPRAAAPAVPSPQAPAETSIDDGDEATEDEATEDEATEDEATEDEATEDEASAGEEETETAATEHVVERPVVETPAPTPSSDTAPRARATRPAATGDAPSMRATTTRTGTWNPDEL